MATDKVFTVAGTSMQEGEMKVRFANDVMRVKVLSKHGHTEITLIELPEAMTKLAAVKFIQALDEFQGATEQLAIDDYLDRNDTTPAVAVVTPAVKVKAPAAAKKPAKAKPVTQDEDQPIGIDQLEDAPF